MNPTASSPSAARSGTFKIGDDLPVHRLGFGAMRITGKGIWGEPPDAESCRQVLRRAVELGVTFIDTSDAYGPEVSERLIAEALHPYPEGLVIATKGGLTRQAPVQWEPVAGPEGVLDRSAKQHGASVAQLSLARLLHRSPVSLPIPGTSSVKHREENVAAANLQLDASEWQAVESAAKH